MHRLPITTCLLGLIGLFAAPALALTLPQGVTQGPSIQGVTQYSLENGLKVLLAPDGSKSTTTVNMTYLVGSRMETYGTTGIAHLLEHMVFRGTPAHPDPMGAFSRLGLAANGSTTADRTNYYASFAANPKTLDWYLGWQADSMAHAGLTQKDLSVERTVVRNEMERDHNSPVQSLAQTMRSAAYKWHNYGRGTMGAKSDVENIDVDQLRAFYTRYYQPDNAVLIVAGKFNPEATLKTIAGDFSALARPARTLAADHTLEPVQDGEREVTLRRHGGSPFIGVMYHIPSASSAQYIPLSLGVDILSDTPSGPLYHALVESKLSTGVFGYTAAQREPGYAFFGAQMAAGADQAKALAVMENTLEGTSRHPFTQADLDRIRRQWLTAWDQTYASPSNLAAALSQASAHGDWRLFFLARSRVKSSTLAQVQKATDAYLVRSNRTAGLYIPTEKPMRAPAPVAVDLNTLLKDFHGRKAPKPVAAFDASPANINAKTQTEPLTLPNGTVKLALLPKPTRGDQVQASLMLQFGTAGELRGKRAVSSAVADLLDHGTKNMSRQQIQDKFDALQADVSFDGSADTVVVDMSTKSKYLPQVVELVLTILRHADFPAQELASYQRQAGAAIKDAMASPSALASKALDRNDNPWPSDDIRYTPTFKESLRDIEALTRQDLLAFHKKFYGAGDIEFAAVGAFDPASVRQALAKGLRGWRKAPAHTRIASPWHAVPPKQFTINTPDKTNAIYLSTLPVKVQDTDPDYPALYMANYLLGASETSRLWSRIRVQDGLSYTVQSSLDVSSFEPSGDWTIYAITAPQNTARVKSDVAQELARALHDGFTEDEVRNGIASLLEYRKLALAHDGAIAGIWLNYMQLGRNFDWWAKTTRALKSLTAAKVNKAMRAVLKPDQFSTAIAGDIGDTAKPSIN
jgi:zinc protease